MRDIVTPGFVAYLMLAGLVVAVLLTIYSGLIADWLIAREERKKKAAAEAKAGAEAKSG